MEHESKDIDADNDGSNEVIPSLHGLGIPASVFSSIGDLSAIAGQIGAQSFGSSKAIEAINSIGAIWKDPLENIREAAIKHQEQIGLFSYPPVKMPLSYIPPPTPTYTPPSPTPTIFVPNEPQKVPYPVTKNTIKDCVGMLVINEDTLQYIVDNWISDGRVDGNFVFLFKEEGVHIYSMNNEVDL